MKHLHQQLWLLLVSRGLTSSKWRRKDAETRMIPIKSLRSKRTLISKILNFCSYNNILLSFQWILHDLYNNFDLVYALFFLWREQNDFECSSVTGGRGIENYTLIHFSVEPTSLHKGEIKPPFILIWELKWWTKTLMLLIIK